MFRRIDASVDCVRPPPGAAPPRVAAAGPAALRPAPQHCPIDVFASVATSKGSNASPTRMVLLFMNWLLDLFPEELGASVPEVPSAGQSSCLRGNRPECARNERSRSALVRGRAQGRVLAVFEALDHPRIVPAELQVHPVGARSLFETGEIEREVGLLA